MHDLLLIEARLTTVSSLYIGAAGDRDTGRTRDLALLRNPLDGMPLIPGTSLRGRMAALLRARPETPEDRPDLKPEPRALSIMFGGPDRRSALSFWDCPLEVPWAYDHRAAGLALTHWRAEKAPSRGERAWFRRRELVSAGVRFRFRLSLLVTPVNAAGLPVQSVLDTIVEGLRLLEAQGIGGSTVRGFGRITFTDIKVSSADGQPSFGLRQP